MDNSLPNNPVQSSTQGDGTVPQVPQPSAQPSVTPQPVGSIAKEHGPLGSAEFIKPSGAEAEPEVSPELVEYGVEAVASPESINLSHEAKQAGVTPAKEAVPVSSKPTGAVTLPMTEEEATRVIKIHKKVSDSIVWLATLILKHAKLVHSKIIAKQ